MPDLSQQDLSKYRLNTAEEKLGAARVLLGEGYFKDAIGRSYYSIFSSMRAVLALDGVDFSKHSAVISYFQRNYVKQRIFDPEYSDIITSAFVIRNLSDYDDMFIASKKDAEKQIEAANKFLEAVKEYLLQRTA